MKTKLNEANPLVDLVKDKLHPVTHGVVKPVGGFVAQHFGGQSKHKDSYKFANPEKKAAYLNKKSIIMAKKAYPTFKNEVEMIYKENRFPAFNDAFKQKNMQSLIAYYDNFLHQFVFGIYKFPEEKREIVWNDAAKGIAGTQAITQAKGQLQVIQKFIEYALVYRDGLGSKYQLDKYKDIGQQKQAGQTQSNTPSNGSTVSPQTQPNGRTVPPSLNKVYPLTPVEKQAIDDLVQVLKKNPKASEAAVRAAYEKHPNYDSGQITNVAQQLLRKYYAKNPQQGKIS